MGGVLPPASMNSTVSSLKEDLEPLWLTEYVLFQATEFVAIFHMTTEHQYTGEYR